MSGVVLNLSYIDVSNLWSVLGTAFIVLSYLVIRQFYVRRSAYASNLRMEEDPADQERFILIVSAIEAYAAAHGDVWPETADMQTLGPYLESNVSLDGLVYTRPTYPNWSTAPAGQLIATLHCSGGAEIEARTGTTEPTIKDED